MRLSFGFKNQLRVNVPGRCSERAVWQFLEENRAWIEARLASLPQATSVLNWLQAHPYVSASGVRFKVEIDRSNTCQSGSYRFSTKAAVDTVMFVWPEGVSETAFIKLIRSFACDALQCRLLYHCERLNITLPPLGVRDQVSRWGSCSTKRRISLNWRLVLLEPDLQDYVILHEIAHLTEMNHSSRFWTLLEQYDPKREIHEAQLDRVGSTIMRVGR